MESSKDKTYTPSTDYNTVAGLHELSGELSYLYELCEPGYDLSGIRKKIDYPVCHDFKLTCRPP